ncbi:helix-turn-helix transcriptional regulator [Streptomyces sp. NBC_00444]|uniref:helix-turn-helix domain-containing protein n=1 Tax=Streptomyces sp. NBC_00444 TaxID=2975744 RepID=UPI002E20D750
MTDADATPTRKERFGAVALRAAERAGYTGHGRNARFARDTGMTESSVGRMFLGQAIPDPRFFQAIADAVGLHPGVLFVEAGLMSQEALQSLSETDRSQVISSLTPDDVADRFDIRDAVGREMLRATIERLKRLEDGQPSDHTEHGGTAAQM